MLAGFELGCEVLGDRYPQRVRQPRSSRRLHRRNHRGTCQANRGPTIITDRRPVSGFVLVIAWLLAVLSLGYMLPWAIAATRGKSNQAAVGLISFFLGWSVIGWIAAMVMACQAHQVAGFSGQIAPSAVSLAAVVQTNASLAAAAGWYPAPQGGGQQYWDGAAWTTHRAP